MSKYYYSKADVKAMSNERLLAAFYHVGGKVYKTKMRKAGDLETLERETLTLTEELTLRFGVCPNKLKRALKE